MLLYLFVVSNHEFIYLLLLRAIVIYHMFEQSMVEVESRQKPQGIVKKLTRSNFKKTFRNRETLGDFF